ncbi:hypothetical protein KR100_01980 [Synechococcus sp. KORDI-100]|nr:hypothetical protein KR100_01980 [Synechococcus sp. KORDI-100]
MEKILTTFLVMVEDIIRGVMKEVAQTKNGEDLTQTQWMAEKVTTIFMSITLVISSKKEETRVLT